MNKSISQILADAADIQEVHGKCEGVLMSYEGKVCAEGAIALAEGLEVHGRYLVLTYESEATEFFAKHVSEVTGKQYNTPWAWNDGIVDGVPIPDCGTVVEELRRASKYADEKGL